MSPPPTQRRQPAKKKPKPATRAATDVLRVRMYNVLFGDAILVSVPDRDAAGDHGHAPHPDRRRQRHRQGRGRRRSSTR